MRRWRKRRRQCRFPSMPSARWSRASNAKCRWPAAGAHLRQPRQRRHDAPLRAVVETLNEFVEWYASIHRGTGSSRSSPPTSTSVPRGRRRLHRRRPRATTPSSLSRTPPRRSTRSPRLLHLAPGETIVLTTLMEHHSNMLPWRTPGPVRRCRAVRRARRAPSRRPTASARLREPWPAASASSPCTGASNVTGHLPPIRRIARLAHEHGALLLVDAAQLAAHRPFRHGRPRRPRAHRLHRLQRPQDVRALSALASSSARASPSMRPPSPAPSAAAPSAPSRPIA